MDKNDKRTIRVWFADSFDSYARGLFQTILEQNYNVIYDEHHPQFLFYSVWGYEHLTYGEDCIKVMYSGENLFPNFNEFDYAISSTKLEYMGRHLYLPPCCYHDTKGEANLPLEDLNPGMAKRRFCCFMFRQSGHGDGSALREDLCKALSANYKRVDCPGHVLHNMDAPELSQRYTNDWSTSKIKFLTQYKFNIAYENSNSPGYVTEKLTDCFKANTVPIYWGSEGTDLPKDAMIYANDYPDMESLIKRIMEVDNNDEEYMRILAANPLRHGISYNRHSQLSEFICNIVEHGTKLPHALNSFFQGDGAFRLIYATQNGKRRGLTQMFLRLLQLVVCLKSILPWGNKKDLKHDRMLIGGLLWREKVARLRIDV